MTATSYAKLGITDGLSLLAWCRTAFGDERTAILVGSHCQCDLVDLMNQVKSLTDNQIHRLDTLHAFYGRILNVMNGDEEGVQDWITSLGSLDEDVSPIGAISEDRDDIVETVIKELEMNHVVEELMFLSIQDA